VNNIPDSVAVIDLETTGFGSTDRILEIAIIIVNDGKISQEWETLVNPLRDIPNKNVHGLGSEEISLAPTFEEISDQIAFLLNGKVLVSHNLIFDSRMLIQEFMRLNKEIDLGEGFCTLKGTKLSLARACESFGIENEGAHRALTDARAATELLFKTLPNLANCRPTQSDIILAPPPARVQCREEELGNDTLAGMETIRKKIPDFDDTGYSSAQMSYAEALYAVMSDFYISPDESDYLSEWAESIGLSSEERLGVHQDYVNLLLFAANRDNYVSETEKNLIKKACQSLEILPPIFTEVSSNSINLVQGKKICFTGTTYDAKGNLLTKEVLAELAIEKGYVPVSTVTKKSCDVLVAAELSSMSSKTQLARKYGIQIISVKEFLDL
jgi:DNA polymerase-3 subunit epsilon